MTFSIGRYDNIAWQVPGVDDETGEVLTEEDVRDMVLTFLNDRTGEFGDDVWRTIHVRVDGRYTTLTFRASWVAAFSLDRNKPEVWK